jgi:hypothetical protein
MINFGRAGLFGRELVRRAVVSSGAVSGEPLEVRLYPGDVFNHHVGHWRTWAVKSVNVWHTPVSCAPLHRPLHLSLDVSHRS